MNRDINDTRGYGFVVGLAAGTAVGAGLALWLAQRLDSTSRRRLRDGGVSLAQQACDQYERATAAVRDAASSAVHNGQQIRDGVAEAVAQGAHEVARGAHEVERMATAARTSMARSS